jgi:site-specific recombinase XerD
MAPPADEDGGGSAVTDPHELSVTTDRQQLMTLLAADGTVVQPSVYDRLEAWWYGAAANTRRAFAADVRAWKAFCAGAGVAASPASPLTVRDFVRAQHRAGRKASSISRHLASIAILHDIAGHTPSPTRDRVVYGEMKGIRREQGLAGRGATRQARPMRLKGDVADIFSDAPQAVSVLGLIATLPASPAGLRDRVLLLLGADLGRRRSEYVAMNLGDIAVAADGSGTALIRRSKTDQAGAGQVKYLSRDAMAAIAEWLSLREGLHGSPLPPSAPLLTSIDRLGRIGGRLSEDGLRDVLRRIVRRAVRARNPDMDDADVEREVAGFSGHSFRVGFAQDLVAAGAEIAAICQAADWRSPEMPVRYARALSAQSGAVATLRKKMDFRQR